MFQSFCWSLWGESEDEELLGITMTVQHDSRRVMFLHPKAWWVDVIRAIGSNSFRRPHREGAEQIKSEINPSGGVDF